MPTLAQRALRHPKVAAALLRGGSSNHDQVAHSGSYAGGMQALNLVLALQFTEDAFESHARVLRGPSGTLSEFPPQAYLSGPA